MRNAFKIFIFLLSVSLFTTAISHAQKVIYNMQDLRVLKAQESFLEFFDHALDIKPSLRDTEWSKMTEQMGIAWLENLLQKPKLTAEDYALVKKISHWPIFKNDEFFREKRDAYFIRQLKACRPENYKKCREVAKRLFLDYQHGIKFKSDFIAALYPHILSIQDAWPYVESVAISKYGEFYCHKPPLDEIILSRMLTHKETEVHQDCLKSLAPKVMEDYLAADPEHSQGLYKLVQKLGIKEPTLDLYQQTLQFLKGHKKDLAVMKTISKDEEIRAELLKKFKDSPYLPDDIFQTKNKEVSQSYLRILTRYFPEYLKLYGKTCLEYLSGERTFPRGNPTPQCHDMFELNAKLNLLPGGYQTRYLDYTKFMRQ